MVRQAIFPRTENLAINDLNNLGSDITSSQLIRIYQPSSPISSRRAVSELVKGFSKQSFYEVNETQGRGSSKYVVPIIQKENSQQGYTQSSMSRVNLIDIKQKVAIVSDHNIPVASPIHSLESLKTGWDGYWAEPFSQEILVRANQLWRQIERITINQSELPTVQPAANGSVAFTWSHKYSEKELEIWLYDQPDYYAEWMLVISDKDEENASQSQADLLKVIKRYQEL